MSCHRVSLHVDQSRNGVRAITVNVIVAIVTEEPVDYFFFAPRTDSKDCPIVASPVTRDAAILCRAIKKALRNDQARTRVSAVSVAAKIVTPKAVKDFLETGHLMLKTVPSPCLPPE